MALRSRTLGLYPDERREVLGPQSEILASIQPDGTIGIADDTGATLVFNRGAWAVSAGASFARAEDIPPSAQLGAMIGVGGVAWVSDGLGQYHPVTSSHSQSTAAAPIDVVVFGATPGGLAAAVRAKRNGASVLLLEPSQWIGGMLTGGIAATDAIVDSFGWTTATIPGFADEFYRRVSEYYIPNYSQFFFYKNYQYHCNLWLASRILQQVLSEEGIEVRLGVELISADTTPVVLSGVSTNRIASIMTSQGRIYGRQFVDATYEGDLIAAAGCTVSIGREASATYSEVGAGVTSSTAYSGDPYVVPGDAGSGLLYGLEAASPPAVGAADARVQGITFRFPFTKIGTKVAHTAPSDYDASRYEWLGRYAAISGGGWSTLNDVVTLYVLGQTSDPIYPNVDVNSRGPMSTNWVGPEATEWITASYTRRQQIQEQIRSWIMGFLWFVQTDSRIPAAVRADAASYGFPTNEFGDYDNFPPYLYFREGRRLVGDFVLTWDDIKQDNAYTDPVAFAYYSADSHSVRRYVSAGQVYTEGAMLNAPTTIGARIPMRIILPKAAEVCNLVATFATSVSRMAFCSIRMEPIHMSVGEFAGSVAALAAKRQVSVQSITWAEVAPRTTMGRYLPNHAGDVLLFADNTRTSNGTVSQSGGVWTLSSAPRWAQVSKDASCATAGATIRFAPILNTSGRYKILVHFPVVPTSVDATPATAAPVTIAHAGGTTTVPLNQRGVNAGADGNWVDLGDYLLRANAVYGSASADYVEFGTDGSGTAPTRVTGVKFQRIM